MTPTRHASNWYAMCSMVKRSPNFPRSFRLSPESVDALETVVEINGWSKTHAVEVALLSLAGRERERTAPPPPILVVPSRQGWAVYRGKTLLAEYSDERSANELKDKLS